MDKELQIKDYLRELLGADIDTDTLDYFQDVISDSTDESAIRESLIPLLEANGIEDAEALCSKLCDRLQVKKAESTMFDTVLLSSCIQLSQVAKTQISEAEQAQIDAQWGFDKIRAKKNEVIEMTEAGSAKYERHAEKEQKRWLAELEEKFIGEEDSGEQVSAMTLPDYSGNSREKDIHVQNFNITFGGKLLLENADLRLVFGRRYGLVGKNGVGKTTLLRHMANFDIEGFPRHHRVLHVKQEVQASEATVLQTVLASDVERNALLSQEAQLVERQQSIPETSVDELQSVLSDLSSIQERLEQIGAHAVRFQIYTASFFFF
jgi:ATP-binding cassette, subfamily F, member 3